MWFVKVVILTVCACVYPSIYKNVNGKPDYITLYFLSFLDNNPNAFCYLSFTASIFVQAQHSLQDTGASEAPGGAQRLHDEPGSTGQPAEPCTHSLPQPEAQDTQVAHTLLPGHSQMVPSVDM